MRAPMIIVIEVSNTHPTGVGPEDWEWTNAVGLLAVAIAGDTGADLYIDRRGG